MFDVDHFWELNSNGEGCFKSQECSFWCIVATESLAMKTRAILFLCCLGKIRF